MEWYKEGYAEPNILTQYTKKEWDRIGTDNNKPKTILNMKVASKVKHVTGNGTWEGEHGLFYKFEYTFEDGVILSAMHKTQSAPFKIGDDVEYEVKSENTHGKNGKVSKPDTGGYTGGGSRGGNNADYVKGIEVGHAVNNAVNLICAGMELDTVGEKNCKTVEEKIYESAKIIMQIAARLKSEH